MAYKTENETLTMVQAYGALELDARTWLAGTFTTDMKACADQITVGDETPEQFVQKDALRRVWAAANGLYEAIEAACRTLHPTLGRLASSQNLADEVTNLAAFNDYLIANSRKVESRGLTKNAWAAGGSNTGTGAVLALNTDPLGDEADIAHVGSLQLLCRTDSQTPGITAGNEEFEVYGTKAGDFSWEEGGAGSSGESYGYQYGRGTNEYGAGYETIFTGSRIRAVSAGNTAANLLTNGDFESSLSGTDVDKIEGCTITGTASHFSLVTSAANGLIRGVNSLKNETGGDVLTYYIDSGLKPRVPYAYTLLLKTMNGGSGTVTGSMTLVLKDDSTTFQTLTIDLSTLTPGTLYRQTKTFIAPQNVTSNLRLEVTYPSYGGTGASKIVVIDELLLTELRQLDGGRAIALVAGATDFRYNDSFTASTTDAASGKMQGFFNRVFGRYFKHDATPAVWLDW